MPWNTPGGDNNNQDPWKDKREQKPPDLDKLLSDFIKKCQAFFSSKKASNPWQSAVTPSTRIPLGPRFALGAGVVIILWILSGFFIVNPAEEAVMLRFGKYTEVLQPGLHWFARFIETKYIINAQKIYSFSLKGDFITKSSGQTTGTNLIAADQVSTSADQSKNLINVELNVQYRISDPRAYLFNMAGPDATIAAVASSALSDSVGQMKLDDVLTVGRETLSQSILTRVKQVLGTYNAGLEVMSVTLRKVQAPDQVRAAFSDVNRADQDKATYIQQAAAYASKVVPIAQGVAARILADASADQQKIILTAQAAVAKYQAIATVYSEAPAITRERLYLETMQSIFKKTSKIVMDGNAGNNVTYLPLDKLMKQNNTSESTHDSH